MFPKKNRTVNMTTIKEDHLLNIKLKLILKTKHLINSKTSVQILIKIKTENQNIV